MAQLRFRHDCHINAIVLVMDHGNFNVMIRPTLKGMHNILIARRSETFLEGVRGRFLCLLRPDAVVTSSSSDLLVSKYHPILSV